MAFKTILSVIGVDNSERDIKNAIEFCRSADAHLSLLVLSMAAPPPIGAYGEIVSASWQEEREDDISALANATETAKEMLAVSGISYDALDVYTEFAWADEDVARSALYADLTLVGQEAAMDVDLKKRILDGALFQSPTPVLFNPTGKPATLAPKSVLVAWDSGIEAGRSVHSALPILRMAEEVHVTLIDPTASEDRNGEEPGAEIAAYLARHGAKVSVEVLSSGGKTIAQVLNQHADDVVADLIVMGAYSHSRLRERIFGGVTRDMLDSVKRPIFLTH
jgi:nucleotide-binding universal stress UspA family protein